MMLHRGRSLPLSTFASTEAHMDDSDRGHQERHFPEPFAFRRNLEAAGFFASREAGKVGLAKAGGRLYSPHERKAQAHLQGGILCATRVEAKGVWLDRPTWAGCCRPSKATLRWFVLNPRATGTPAMRWLRLVTP